MHGHESRLSPAIHFNVFFQLFTESRLIIPHDPHDHFNELSSYAIKSIRISLSNLPNLT